MTPRTVGWSFLSLPKLSLVLPVLLVLQLSTSETSASAKAAADGVRIAFLRPQADLPLFDVIEVEIGLELPGEELVERVELHFEGGLVGALGAPPWRWPVDVGPHNRDHTFYVDVHVRGGEVKRAELFVPRFEADA